MLSTSISVLPMNENIKAGADIHAGDGGYSLGTREEYEKFVKMRNQSLTQISEPALRLANIWANQRSEDEKLGITYTFSERALEAFVQEIVKECSSEIMKWKGEPFPFDENTAVWIIKEHFKIGQN